MVPTRAPRTALFRVDWIAHITALMKALMRAVRMAGFSECHEIVAHWMVPTTRAFHTSPRFYFLYVG